MVPPGVWNQADTANEIATGENVALACAIPQSTQV
jgi:hypothetical protein